MFGGGSGSGFGGIALYEMGRQAGMEQRDLEDATQAFVERLQGRQNLAVDVGPLLAENNALRYEVARLSQELANTRAQYQQLLGRSKSIYQELLELREAGERLQEWSRGAYQELLKLDAERAKR